MSPRAAEELLYFNGVNGATGGYGLEPMTGEELARRLVEEEPPGELRELRYRAERKGVRRGLGDRIDAGKLAETGWGVVFPSAVDPAVVEALGPLLKLRQGQAGERFQVYQGDRGYHPGESKSEFLARYGMGPGPVDPDRVPYYLLLVGGPETIPYRFQTQLDIQYAVGRIAFATADEYAAYAAGVVAAETAGTTLPRRVGFFGVANPDDPATALSTEHLVDPLVRHLRDGRAGWQVDTFLGERATKANLAACLGGAQTPAVLFTASHGMEFPAGDPRQLPHQGALLCGDWPGPAAWQGKGPIPQDFYFAGDDVAEGARLGGLVTFHFACYGAGTPNLDDFPHHGAALRRTLAPHPFLAALPARLLGRGALAAVGHVDRVWGYSFYWPGARSQTRVFEDAFDRLLRGLPVGHALEFFNERYAELATVLADQIQDFKHGGKADPYELAGQWTANNDARGYLLLGDPAVRLPEPRQGDRLGTPGSIRLSRKRGIRGSESTPRQAPQESASPWGVPESASVPGEVASAPPPPAAPAPPAPLPEDKAVTEESLSFGVAQDADPVRFSAFHPRALPVGEARKLLVYAHLPDAAAAVATDAGQRLGKERSQYRERGADATMPIAPGTVITVVPAGRGLRFDPPQAQITWSGAWQRADFTMTATGEVVGHVIEGSVACYVGPLLIADVRLPVVVPRAGEPPADASTTDRQSAAMYQSIFVSYSHADTAVVEALEVAYKALGMEYLRDVMTLRSGQKWSEELMRLIDRADVFQLFWSEPASVSAYVEQEWRQALWLSEQKGSAFIRPIYWQQPLPAVPAELSHVHFACVDLGGKAPVARPAGDAVVAVTPTSVGDLASLTVSTYSAVDPADSTHATLRARTRVDLGGDIETYLAEDCSEELLELHQKTVGKALRARLDYLALLSRGGRPS